MDTAATSSTAAPSPNDPRFLRWEGLFPAEAARLRSMTPADLLVTADALRAACDGFQSIYNMPRCEAASSSMIEREMERLGSILEMAMEEIERRPFDGSHHDDDRIRAIALYELNTCGAGILDTMAKLVSLHAARERADFIRREREAA